MGEWRCTRIVLSVVVAVNDTSLAKSSLPMYLCTIDHIHMLIRTSG